MGRPSLCTSWPPYQKAIRRQVGQGGRHFVLLGHHTGGIKVAGGAGVTTLYFMATVPQAPGRQVGRGSRHFVLHGHHTRGTKAAGGFGVVVTLYFLATVPEAPGEAGRPSPDSPATCSTEPFCASELSRARM